MSAEIVPFRSRAAIERTRGSAEMANLSPDERALAVWLLRLMPNYRYDLSRLPPINPAPAPGLPSVVAAIKAITARLNALA
jgi:hypothetical protein